VRGIRIGAPWEVAGRIGSVAAALVLESLGPQPPGYAAEEFRARYARSFEDEPLLGRLFSEEAAPG
jgi:sugar/nucleoside kinase (ribokinase family)